MARSLDMLVNRNEGSLRPPESFFYFYGVLEKIKPDGGSIFITKVCKMFCKNKYIDLT